MGTRKSINIWSDYWILGVRSLKQIMREEEINDSAAIVDNLIDNHIKWWDVDKVRNPLGVKSLKQITR